MDSRAKTAPAVTPPVAMNGFLASLEASVPALRRYALAMLSHQQNADDIVHSCLFRAVRSANALGDPDKLRVWLFGMVYQALTDRSRRRGQRRPSSSSGNNVSAAASTELSRAFSGLPLEQRSAVFLISVEDLSYAAAAEVMGVATMTIVNLLKGAREQLRQSVEAGVSGPLPTKS